MKWIVLLLSLFFVVEAQGANALSHLNRLRARRGLPAYKADSILQRAAERSVNRQAASGGSCYHCCHIGSWSGVGSGTNQFHSCYAFSNGTAYVGCASVRGRNGRMYYALDCSRYPLRRNKN